MGVGGHGSLWREETPSLASHVTKVDNTPPSRHGRTDGRTRTPAHLYVRVSVQHFARPALWGGGHTSNPGDTKSLA